MSRRLLVVLQNSYDRGDLAKGYSPGRWRREFAASRTGRRLKHALPGGWGWDVRFTNACPGIGVGVDSKLVPCRRHLRRALRRVNPLVVLACGRVAESAIVPLWDGPLFAIPHPGGRVVPTELLVRCRDAIVAWHDEPRRPDPPRVAFHLRLGHRAGYHEALTRSDA